MMSTLWKKSWEDLKKRKSRTIFTILTIAIGITAMSLFAVIPLIEQAIESEIETSNMYDVRVTVDNLELNETNFEILENIDNINSVEPKYVFFTRIYIGERRNDALLVGVMDFNSQKVDIVSKDSGHYPGDFEVLTDSGNSRNDLYNGKSGDKVRIYDSNGSVQELTITGAGGSLTYDQSNWGIAVLYTNLETVYVLSNGSGFNALSIDLGHSNEATAEVAIEDIRTYLSANTEFTTFLELPETREEGDWPGKESFADMASFFYVLTFVALFCSFFLISNTMHTIVSEQKKEIAQMKAVGATRLQVVRSYLTTSLIMGIIGATIGAIIGIWIAFMMASFMANSFFGVVMGFMIHPETILLSLGVGLAITMLATLPALILALKVTVREGMEGSGIITNYGSSSIDKLLIHTRWVPRTAQMGIRNVGRKKGRSTSMIIQVALAVGILLAVLSIGYSMGATVASEFDNFTYDIMVTGQLEAGKPLIEDLEDVIENIEGVAEAEPFLATEIQIGEYDILCFGYYYNTTSYDLEKTDYKGRWFSQQEQESNATVVVVTKGFTRLTGIKVGDHLEADFATGTHNLEVIGINSGQMNHGMVAFMPITTLQDILMWDDIVTGFTINTENSDHNLIDEVSTSVEDELLHSGYVVNIEIMYVMEEQNQQFIQTMTNLMLAVGSLVVLITMIGLMSTLTMNILDRTKEIGMMRCIGSKSHHIRWMFGVEGLIMALVGWLIGIPIGYGIGQYLNQILYETMNIEMTFFFPLEYILISLGLTMLVTILIIQPSLWKATHLKPGDALRYE